MARETHAENQIPDNGAADVPYPDQREVARAYMGHAQEAFIGQVTGGGGIGGSLLNVPFEPAIVEIINEAGATPTWTKHVNLGSGFIGVAIAAATIDVTAGAPTITRVGEGDFTVALVTGDAPDAEVVTVICHGVRDTGGGL